jgi:hypothetical protein
MSKSIRDRIEIGFSFSEFAVLIVLASAVATIVFVTLSSVDSFTTSTQLEFPANLASIASSVATLFLVALTGWYTLETRRMVNLQKEMRTIESVEDWYRQVLTEARILHRTWGNILRDSSPSDKGYLADEETLNEMSERVESLLELYGSCPGDVPDDIRNLLSQLYSDWYFTRVGGDMTYLPANHDAKEDLDELIERIKEESIDFSEEQ